MTRTVQGCLSKVVLDAGKKGRDYSQCTLYNPKNLIGSMKCILADYVTVLHATTQVSGFLYCSDSENTLADHICEVLVWILVEKKPDSYNIKNKDEHESVTQFRSRVTELYLVCKLYQYKDLDHLTLLPTYSLSGLAILPSTFISSFCHVISRSTDDNIVVNKHAHFNRMTETFRSYATIL